MERWEGKVAVVTGASSGIGAAIAESLVKNGMNVVGLARREERLKDLEKKYTGRKGKFYPIKADLSKEDDISKAFQEIDLTLGAVHVLVNNAGLSKPKYQSECTSENLREIYDVNIIALQLCSKEALKSMNAHNINDGYIINISSMIAHITNPRPRLGVYYASKVAVNAIGESLRVELASLKSNIRVTTISPGVCETEIFEVAGAVIPKSVLELALQPSDIAECVLFVLQLKQRALVPELLINTTADIRAALEEHAKTAKAV